MDALYVILFVTAACLVIAVAVLFHNKHKDKTAPRKDETESSKASGSSDSSSAAFYEKAGSYAAGSGGGGHAEGADTADSHTGKRAAETGRSWTRGAGAHAGGFSSSHVSGSAKKSETAARTGRTSGQKVVREYVTYFSQEEKTSLVKCRCCGVENPLGSTTCCVCGEPLERKE